MIFPPLARTGLLVKRTPERAMLGPIRRLSGRAYTHHLLYRTPKWLMLTFKSWEQISLPQRIWVTPFHLDPVISDYANFDQIGFYFGEFFYFGRQRV
jgi:hypothetical protein